MEVPGGDWVVNAMDPQGASFALHAKKAQSRDAGTEGDRDGNRDGK